jgi:hypothetical protein
MLLNNDMDKEGGGGKEGKEGGGGKEESKGIIKSIQELFNLSIKKSK